MIVIQECRVAEARPGEVVAREVLDAKGTRLVAADTVLTQAMLDMLEKRAIGSITVKRNTTPGAAERRRTVQEALSLRFRRHAGNALMEQLKATIAQYHHEKSS